MATLLRSPGTINLPSLRTSSASPTPIRKRSPRSHPETLPPSSPVTPQESNFFLRSPGEPWIARVASHRGSRRASPSSRALSFPPRADSTSTPDLEELLLDPLELPSALSRTMSGSSMKRKVVIMGAPSVGKTSLTQQYIAPPTYTEQYYPTIEATSHKTAVFGGVEYDCEIIDSAGQDEYTLFNSKYAVGVHGYILVYSINSRQSFEMIETIHEKILDFAGVEQVPCVIVGQKSDLSGERQVTAAQGDALAKKLHAAFVESSARNNDNVVKVFESLLGEMQRKYNPAPEKKKKGWFGW